VEVEAGGEAEFLDPLRKEVVERTWWIRGRASNGFSRRWRRGYGRSWPNCLWK